MKKQIIFLVLTAFTLNVNAQLNKEWSTVQSISGGIYRSSPVSMWDEYGKFSIASNEYFEPTEDSIKGVTRRYNSTGALQWTTIIPEVAVVSGFELGEQRLAGISNLKTRHFSDQVSDIYLCYNVSSTESRLIKIDSTGAIVLNMLLTNTNCISDWEVDSLGSIYLCGRTPQTTCGASVCNGIAVEKYNSSGGLVWTETKYITGYRTVPIDITLDPDGRLIVCGKKAANTFEPQTAYDRTFVTVFDNSGVALWTKESNSILYGGTLNVETESDPNGDLWFADTQYDPQTNFPSVKLRKLNGTTGATIFTKTINNAEFKGLGIVNDDAATVSILSTTAGMKAYNSAGTLLWSNNFISVGGNLTTLPYDYDIVIAQNVDAANPEDNYLIKLDNATGAVLYQKNISFGNHEEYMGDFAGITNDDNATLTLVIKDNVAPYGTRITQLSECSAFTYNFIATATAVNVINTTCDNGEINVNWSGIFNSWMHMELWKGSSLVNKIDFTLPTTSHTFQNLLAGAYTVKAFDESCGEQDIAVNVKCTEPGGLSTTNISRNKARLNWTLPACNAGVQLQYRLQGALSWTTVNTSGNYRQLNGLIPNSFYEWRVATKCGTGTPSVYSDLCALQLFSTPAQRLAEEPETEEANEFNVFPNPASEKLSVKFSSLSMSNYNLQILDATGRMIFEKTGVSLIHTNTTELDISSLSEGIYFLRYTSREITEQRKIVIE
jgi:hypothetical protein